MTQRIHSIVPGAVYVLDPVEAGPGQRLAFYHRQADGTVLNGATTETILRVLRDRFQQVGHEFNADVIGHLNNTLIALFERNDEARARGAEEL